MLILAGICTGDMLTIVGIVRKAVTLLQIAIPIALILFGTIDLFKAVVAQKEDEIKAAQGLLLKRFLYGIVVFLIFILVRLIMGLVGNNEWKTCWEGANEDGVIRTK